MKTVDYDKTIEDLKKTAAELEKSPMVLAFRAEEAARTLEERRIGAAKLRAAKEEAETIIPDALREIDALAADLAAHDESRAIIADKLTTARAELMQERQRLDRERAASEAALLSNYDPRIDMAILFFRDRFETLRAKHINAQHRTGETNIYTETKGVVTFSNVYAIEAALAYCRAAIDELEKMKLVADPDLDRIYELRKEIPDPDILTESVGSKPLPGSKGVNPLHLLPTDSEMDWKFGKLAEKFKKVMTGR